MLLRIVGVHLENNTIKTCVVTNREKTLEIKTYYPYYVVRDVTTCKQTMCVISGGYDGVSWCDVLASIINA